MFYPSPYTIKKITDPKIHMGKKIYLTFDDGPDPYFTKEVLEVLHQYKAKATFFLIVNKVKENPHLFSEILKNNHGIANHSLDHSYAPFFTFIYGKKFLQDWVLKSQDFFKEMMAKEYKEYGEIYPYKIPFRSPAGIVTKDLILILKEMNIPLVHWNIRFYDTNFQFSEKKALNAVKKIQAGDIILLHDGRRNSPSQIEKNKKLFLRGLQTLIEESKEKGFEFSSLPNF